MSWKTGDVVELKSGGPAMTVDILRDDGFCECSWFAGAERVKDTFRADMLQENKSHSPQVIPMDASDLNL